MDNKEIARDLKGSTQRRYDMRREMLTQQKRQADSKKGTLSQHFVTHVVPPLGSTSSRMHNGSLPPYLVIKLSSDVNFRSQ